MKLDDLKDKVVKVITKRIKLPHYKIFYFGSRVAGNNVNRSDIDIGIEAAAEIPLSVLSEIETELAELPIMQKIDVVDFKVVSEDFKKVALQNIEVIYEQ